MTEQQKDLGFSDEKYLRGLVSVGNLGKLKVFRDKLKAKKPIVYGAIGGSITQGASAKPGQSYGDLLAKCLEQQTPTTFVNAGIGASNSLFGTFRAQKDLLSHMPDLVTIEYAVNDTNNPRVAMAYESLVRQCVMCPSKPLVITIFTMLRNGDNVQDVHIPIGDHYGLAILSYRDAIYPDITAGDLVWGDVSPDEVHPNDAGHAFMFEMLRRYMDKTQVDLQDSDVVGEVDVPKTCLDPQVLKYCGGRIIDASQMKVLSCEGWTQGPHKAGYLGYQSQTPGAELVVEFTGRLAYLGYQKYAGDFGQIQVTLDDKVLGVFEGHYEKPLIQQWAGGHTVIDELSTEMDDTVHVVRFKLLSQTHSASHGHMFDIGYLLVN
ncbi:MAG: SGNH/GDSL hydrolase family protein [Phycisphaeraceae bacterium]|nr:SGNH/GDSL hydrolase family protein [Phycisphaeraceae bacterium]